jgi:transcriptional regulator with XRE-family HTH domain
MTLGLQTPMAPFNELLKEAREAARLTQEQLAVRAGLTASTVAKLERRKRPPDPSWSTVQKIARALGVDESAFRDQDLFPREEAERPRARPRKGK